MLEKEKTTERLIQPSLLAIIGYGKTGSFFLKELSHSLDQNIIIIDRDSWEKIHKKKPPFILLTIPNPIDDALSKLSELYYKGLTIILPQNGVAVVPTAFEFFKEKEIEIIRASLLTTVAEDENRDLIYNPAKKRVGLASVNSNKINIVADLFIRAGFETRIYPDWKAMEWTKLLLNTIGGSGAITGLTPKETFKDTELFQIEIQGLKNRLKILHQAQIPLVNFPGLPINLFDLILSGSLSSILTYFRKPIANFFSRERYNLPPAAAKLLRDGKPTEIEFYHQPFIELGEKYGIKNLLDEVIIFLAKNYHKIKNLSTEEIKNIIINYSKT